MSEVVTGILIAICTVAIAVPAALLLSKIIIKWTDRQIEKENKMKIKKTDISNNAIYEKLEEINKYNHTIYSGDLERIIDLSRKNSSLEITNAQLREKLEMYEKALAEKAGEDTKFIYKDGKAYYIGSWNLNHDCDREDTLTVKATEYPMVFHNKEGNK